MLVVVVEVGKAGEVRDIPKSRSAIVDILGGDPEYWRATPRLPFYVCCNEFFNGLPFNRQFGHEYHGTFIVCRFTPQGDFTSMSPADAAAIADLFTVPGRSVDPRELFLVVGGAR